MPRQALHPSLQGQAVERVNNVPENRERFLNSVFRMVDKIEEIKEYLKDQDYMDLYTIVTELERFKNDLVDTAIYQAVLRKHNLNRAARQILTDAEKRKAGYLTCPHCKSLLQNERMLAIHQETTLKCRNIKTTREITKVQVKNGVKNIFCDGLDVKENITALMLGNPSVKKRMSNYTYAQFVVDIHKYHSHHTVAYEVHKDALQEATPRPGNLPKYMTLYEYYNAGEAPQVE